MARALEANTAQAPPPLSSLGGTVVGAVAKVRNGAEILGGIRPIRIGLFGQSGTGKTRTVVTLLLAGQKVLYITSDFGATGDDHTIFNYFEDHPEVAHFLSNLRVVTVNVKALMQLVRNPSVLPELSDIYEWDPDWLVWDGVSGYQMGDLEQELSGDDFLRKETDYGMWKQTRNGTLFPLAKFLKLENTKTGKPWHKIATFLEAEKFKKRKVRGTDGKMVLEEIEGTEKTGPLLDTTARELANAGFDIMMQTISRHMGDKIVFDYVSRGKDMMVKDRSFNIPPSIQADKFWKEIIGAKLKWN